MPAIGRRALQPTAHSANVAKDTAKILIDEIDRLSIEEQELVKQFGQLELQNLREFSRLV